MGVLGGLGGAKLFEICESWISEVHGVSLSEAKMMVGACLWVE